MRAHLRPRSAHALVLAVLALAAWATARDEPRPADGERLAPAPPASARAQTGADSGPPAPPEAARAACRRGLAYLAVQQAAQQDGSFPKAEGSQHAPVALTALSALAFMASGSTPERGPWGAQTAAAVDYLLSKVDLAAGPTRGYIAIGRADEFGMHSHGYATLALAQAYAMAPSTTRGARIAEALELAVRVMERSQTLEGGWYYFPDAGLSHENSVTVVVLQALRAARECGVRVDPAVITKAVDYIGRCQNEDGGFRYALDPTSHPSIALTAAGLATLHSAGRYEGPEIERARLQLQRALIEHDGSLGDGDVNFPHYARLYVALALWTQRDQRLFQRWIADERPRVLAEQRPDGSWGDSAFGGCYATAMTCLFLSIEDGLLPLFER